MNLLKGLKKAAMFGLEIRALKKQFGELFLARLHSMAPKEVYGACGYTKRGAMFGLDARIALAVLAITSLSISLVQEKQTFEEQSTKTKQEMEVLAAKFLKHWEKLRFEGFYTLPSGMYVSYDDSNSAKIPGYGKDDKVIRFKATSSWSPNFDKTSYTRSLTSIDYFYNIGNYSNSKTYGGIDQKVFVSNNFKNGYFTGPVALDFISDLFTESATKINLSINSMMTEDGLGLMDNPDEKLFGSLYSGLEGNVDRSTYAIDKQRVSLDRNINFYFIVEYNIDDNSPSDYIVHVVMFTKGKNFNLDTTMPITLEDLDNFAGAQGDDIVYIFNTREVYLRAKLEGKRRLEEIKEKIDTVAEATYLDRLSLCASESTPSASCDLDSDGDYDAQDESLMIDYNPYPKSSLDTSSANYYDNTIAYDFSENKGAETFLSGTLSLPEYYAYDLFGNVLNYDSNVDNRTSGPYTMEVWY